MKSQLTILTILLVIFTSQFYGQQIKNEKVIINFHDNAVNNSINRTDIDLVKVPIDNPEPFLALGINADLLGAVDISGIDIRYYLLHYHEN
jgi:hypothetical protein